MYSADVMSYIPMMVPGPEPSPPRRAIKVQYEPQEVAVSNPEKKPAAFRMTGEQPAQRLTDRQTQTAPIGQQEKKRVPIAQAPAMARRAQSAQAAQGGHSAQTGASSRREASRCTVV